MALKKSLSIVAGVSTGIASNAKIAKIAGVNLPADKRGWLASKPQNRNPIRMWSTHHSRVW
jgi:hypothetical protein